MTAIPVEEQVKALATDLEWPLTFVTLHKTYPTVQEIAALFTISDEDIRAVLRANDSWLAYVRNKPDDSDGYYLISVEGGYETYEQERQVKFNSKKWKTFGESRDAYAAYLIRKLAALRSGAHQRK